MKSTKNPSNRLHRLGDVALEKKRMKKALKLGIIVVTTTHKTKRSACAMIQDFQLNYNSNVKGNWDGGELSSDAGIFLMHQFFNKLNVMPIIEKHFFIESDFAKRTHKNPTLLMQFIYMTILGYHNQDHFNDLRKDPVLMSCFDEQVLASQPTINRFIARLDESTFDQLKEINRMLIEHYFDLHPPEYLIFDIDTTYLETFGNQEGGSYNTHYSCKGLSPILIYDYKTGLCIETDIRPGTTYCSNGTDLFLLPILKRYRKRFTDIARLVRGDAGMASPEIYKTCETTNTSYVIRLKSNAVLQRKAKEIFDAHYTDDKFNEDQTIFGEFMYQAGSWSIPRRVVVEITREKGTLVYNCTFIVTNVDSDDLAFILSLYRQRGNMENFIKEGKNGFAMAKVTQKAIITNQNQLMMKMIAYNLVRMFSALVLPDSLQHHQVETLRNKIFKIAARKVKHARQVVFKFCSHFPLKEAFERTLHHIFTLDFAIPT